LASVFFALYCIVILLWYTQINAMHNQRSICATFITINESLLHELFTNGACAAFLNACRHSVHFSFCKLNILSVHGLGFIYQKNKKFALIILCVAHVPLQSRICNFTYFIIAVFIYCERDSPTKKVCEIWLENVFLPKLGYTFVYLPLK
jgi:hypothetical protein